MAPIHGTRHNDDLTGTSSNDTFDLYKGGNDTASGGGGNDIFNMGASLNAGDRLDGGTGKDVVTLHGDYSAGVVFDDQTITNIEVLRLRAGFDYNLTLADGNVAAGEKLTINAAKLGAGDNLTFDGSAETDGRFIIYGGAGNDTVHGGGGNDTFVLGAALTASDVIDGGSGQDTVTLNGDYGDGVLDFFTFGGGTIAGIETLRLSGDHTYAMILADGNVAAGARMTVDASTTAATDFVSIDGSTETDGAFDFVSGAAGAVFSGSSGNDTFDMRLGTESVVQGGGGNDLFRFGSNFDAGTQVYGDSGLNTLRFEGGSAALVIDHSVVQNIQTVEFASDHSYSGVAISGDIAGGSTLTIDASALSAADSLSIGLGGASSSVYVVKGGAGDDTIEFGSNLSNAGSALSPKTSDIIDGGAGNDTLELNGNFGNIGQETPFEFTIGSIANIETIKLDPGHTYLLQIDDGVLTAGEALTVDASAMNGTVLFDGSLATAGAFHFIAGAGGQQYYGGAGNDVFDLAGATDTDSFGSGGDDTFKFAANYVGADFVHGGDVGTGSDTLSFAGAYASLGLSDSVVQGIQTLRFGGGFNYQNVSVGGNILGDGVNVGVGALTVDGSGAGLLQIDLSGARSDSYDITGGAGGDTFALGTQILHLSTLDGGAGSDTLSLGGDFHADFGLTSLNLSLTDSDIDGIDKIVIANSTALQSVGVVGDITDGAGLTIDASAMVSALTIHLDTATSTGNTVIGGAGNDAIVGNSGSDTITGGLGQDTLTGGGGADTFMFASANQSASTAYDIITDFAAGTDKLDFGSGVSNLNFTNGTVNSGDFDSNLGGLDATHAFGATVVNVTSGDLTGHVYLIVNPTASSLYQAGVDYVVDITGYTGTITLGDFI